MSNQNTDNTETIASGNSSAASGWNILTLAAVLVVIVISAVALSRTF